jgi:hypothetical protein
MSNTRYMDKHDTAPQNLTHMEQTAWPQWASTHSITAMPSAVCLPPPPQQYHWQFLLPLTSWIFSFATGCCCCCCIIPLLHV